MRKSIISQKAIAVQNPQFLRSIKIPIMYTFIRNIFDNRIRCQKSLHKSFLPNTVGDGDDDINVDYKSFAQYI